MGASTFFAPGFTDVVLRTLPQLSALPSSGLYNSLLLCSIPVSEADAGIFDN
jgi:hypothetical protein